MKSSRANRAEKFPVKPALSIGFFLLWLVFLPVFPPLRGLRGLHPEQLAHLIDMPTHFGPVWTHEPQTFSASQANTSAAVAHAPAAHPVVAEPEPGNPPYLLDPRRTLNHFYEALERTARKEPGAETLILHYGDSPVTADLITADARAILQARF